MNLLQRKFINKGFTLIEVLVTLSIMSVFFGIVIFNYVDYRDTVELNSAVNQLSQIIRQAQVYGTNGKCYPETTAPCPSYDIAYTVAFDKSTNPQGYTFYANSVSNTIQNINLQTQGNLSISKLCGVVTDLNPLGCDSSSDLSQMVIIFKRPSLNPVIKTDSASSITYSYAEITIQSPRGKTKTIVVRSSGPMYVK